jgi:hypothetical protein
MLTALPDAVSLTVITHIAVHIGYIRDAVKSIGAAVKSSGAAV